MLSAMGLSASAYPMTSDVMIYHTETALGDGLTYETMYTEQDGVSQKGYLFTYRPGNGVLPIVTYGTHIVGRETTSSMMQLEQKALSGDGVRVLGGMNADFFSMQTGISMGVMIKDGEILSTDAGSGAIGIRENGTFLVGNPSITVTMQRVTDNGAAALTLPIAHVNKYPAVWGAYLCTPAHGKTTYSTEEGTEYVFRTEEGMLSLTGELRATLTEIRENSKNSEIPADGFVIYLHKDCTSAESYRTLSVGDNVSITCTAPPWWCTVSLAIGGGDLLIENGKIHTDGFDKTHSEDENPRTAIGFTADGRLCVFAVDGRTQASKGLTLKDLAETMASFGCIGAINLDGGGSTTVVIRGTGDTFTVQNKPTDGSERKVSNAVLFVDTNVSDGIPYYAEITPNAPLFYKNATVPLQVRITDRSHTVLNAANAEVTWSAVGGTVDKNGILTPDADAKTVTVTAQVRIPVTDAETGVTTEYVLQTSETVYRTEVLDGIWSDVSSIVIPFGGKSTSVGIWGTWKGNRVYISRSDVRASLLNAADGQVVPRALGYIDINLAVHSGQAYGAAQDTQVLFAVTDGKQKTLTTTVPVTIGVKEQVVMNMDKGMPTAFLAYDSTTAASRLSQGGRNGSAAVALNGQWVAPTKTPAASTPVKRMDLWVKGTLPDDLSAVITCNGQEYTLPWTVVDDFTRIGGWMRLSLDTTVIDKKGIRDFTLNRILSTAQSFALTVDDLTYFYGDSIARFTDTYGTWAHDSIEVLYRMGVVNGIANGDGTYRFAPSDGLTRIEFAVMIAKFMGLSLSEDASVEHFADADEIAAWGVPYIAAVTDMGYMRGKGAGTDENGNPLARFASDDTMTRAEVLQVLGALLNTDGEAVLQTAFADDADIPDWARTNITKIVGMGLISGFSDNTLRPTAVMSRAEIAALLVRIHTILTQEAKTPVEEPTEEPTDSPTEDLPTETPAEVPAESSSDLT